MKALLAFTAMALSLGFSAAANAALITYDISVWAYEAPPSESEEVRNGVGTMTMDTELFAFTKVDLSSGFYAVDWSGNATIRVVGAEPQRDGIIAGGYQARTGDLEWVIRQDYIDGTDVLANLGAEDLFGYIELYFDGAPAYMGDAAVSNPRIVPEPSTLALLGLGLFWFGLKRRITGSARVPAQTSIRFTL